MFDWVLNMPLNQTRFFLSVEIASESGGKNKLKTVKKFMPLDFFKKKIKLFSIPHRKVLQF